MAISKSIAVKEVLLFFSFLFSAFFLNAQNVGIGTTTPQATLDVKGNLRTGGNSNFISYDSLSGKIIWTNSNLWVTGPQYLIKHSASAEGLYSNGAQLEYRNQLGNPSFFSNWSNGNGYFSGNLGIGTVSPTAKLQIRDGASGITPFFSARMVVETNNHTYINLLSPDPFETGILFGSGTNAVSGLISYNTTTVPKGFIFNNNGNQTRMVIDNVGRVGIGTTTPNGSALLDISSNNKGFLPPRMTVDERNAIVSPAQGLIIYCTNCGLPGGEPEFFNGTVWSNFVGVNATFQIGMSYLGGKLAYILQPGDPGNIAGQTHGFIAAPSDQGTFRWDNGSAPTYTGASGWILGTGNANTNTIVASQGVVANYAARVCAELVLGGYSDWYLPSHDELVKLYLNRAAIGGFANTIYWSSTESDDQDAYYWDFNGNFDSPAFKLISCHVRAIRTF